MTTQRFFAWLTKNLGWRVIALAIAYVIWINVANEPELATIVSAQVQYRDTGNNLEIASELVDTVEIEARGPSGLLRGLSTLRPAIILDFNDVKDPGERTFTITRLSTNLPKGVELLRATPAQIRLNFERRAYRTVPVHVRFIGNLAQGVQMKDFQVSPSTEEIFGPASQVALVQYVDTDSIDLQSMDAAHPSIQTAVFVPQPKVRFSKPPEVTVKITLP